MDIALACSAHGYGHLTRQLALEAALTPRARVTVIGPDGEALRSAQRAGVRAIARTLDVGIVQKSGLDLDLASTFEAVGVLCSEASIERTGDLLAGYDLVIADCPPLVLEACRRRRVPCKAVASFDWAWIYEHFPTLLPWAEQFRAWQAAHDAGELWPGPGLRGFKSTRPLGLLGRRGTPVRVAERGVLVSFGGFGMKGLDRMLPRIDGVQWILCPPLARLERDDVVWVDDVPYPSLVAGAAAVLTKPGYGIFAETELSGTPVVFVDRPDWPEGPSLNAALLARGDVEWKGEPLGAALDLLWSRPRRTPASDDGAERVARWVLSG